MKVNLYTISCIPEGRMLITKDKGLSIRGQASQTGVPLPCRVRLFEKLSGQLIAEMLTDENGNYEFDHLTRVRFFIVAHHPASQFNAVIQDNVVPK